MWRIPFPHTEVLASVGDVEVRAGGMGSGAALHPIDRGRLYLLTDRGPNYETGPDIKAFPRPDYSPRVIRWELRGPPVAPTGAVLLDVIQLTDSGGKAFSGIPRGSGPGSTGEAAVTIDGVPIPPDRRGIDPEGIHVLADGSFWIAEEYGPSLLHFDSAGRLIREMKPGAAGPLRLPATLARRRPNRGFEALTGDPDGRVLLAFVQAPLDNPPGSHRESRLARVVVVEPETGRFRELLYPLDQPHHVVSGAAWVAPNAVLVLEHDVRFPGGNPDSEHQQIYLARWDQATPVEAPGDEPAGRLLDGRTLEQLEPRQLEQAGIRLITRELVVDLRRLGYPHDKPEGLVLLGPETIGVANDDDFGVTAQRGSLAAKVLPMSGEQDAGELWVVRLRQPIAGGTMP